MFSPHQNVREQDAIESLLFMSSPGNSANLKNSYAGPLASPQSHGIPGLRPSPGPTPAQIHALAQMSNASPAGASQQQQPPQPQQQPPPQPQTQRHALPNSQPPRKSLPSHRPPVGVKRVGFGNSDETETESSDGSRGTLRRKTGTGAGYVPGAAQQTQGSGHSSGHGQPPHVRIHLSLPSALDQQMQPRKRLADEDIDRMLERVAAEESEDDDDEIEIPRRVLPVAHAQAV